MSIIRLPIDIKSLFFNIKNDNQRGHTATVATPIKQGAAINPDLAQITTIPEGVSETSREQLISSLLAKSRALAKINGVFVFDHISVNGIDVDVPCCFCMYIREETAPDNVHCGRQKLHYPTSLFYEDDNILINNRKIIEVISEHLHGYAFLVEAFEYNTTTQTLNFDVIIIGENGIPYSKVFINKRGVGSKFTSQFTEVSDVYDAEIISLREHYGYDVVGPENFFEFMARNNTIAYSLATEFLANLAAEDIRTIKDDYPYSLFDIRCTINGVRKYVVVKQTATKTKYFSLPLSKVQFLNDFAEDALLLLITDINGYPSIQQYQIAELNSLNKSIDSITYTDRT